MSTSKAKRSQNLATSLGRLSLRLLAGFLLLRCTAICCAQGTITIGFQGPPPGVEWQVGGYNDSQSGMQFGTITPQSLYLNGGGIAGYPDNGTCYLETPEGSMSFGFNRFPPSNPIVPFNLVSFVAAEYDSAGPQTLTVVGYHPMAGTVTNYFTVNSQTFQTFYLDSSFNGVFRVDVVNASWSLDDIAISGVPEPGTASLGLLAVFSAVVLRRGFRERN